MSGWYSSVQKHTFFFNFSICLKLFVIKYKKPSLRNKRKSHKTKILKTVRTEYVQVSQKNNPAEWKLGVMQVYWKSLREIH